MSLRGEGKGEREWKQRGPLSSGVAPSGLSLSSSQTPSQSRPLSSLMMPLPAPVARPLQLYDPDSEGPYYERARTQPLWTGHGRISRDEVHIGSDNMHSGLRRPPVDFGRDPQDPYSLDPPPESGPPGIAPASLSLLGLSSLGSPFGSPTSSSLSSSSSSSSSSSIDPDGRHLIHLEGDRRPGRLPAAPFGEPLSVDLGMPLPFDRPGLFGRGGTKRSAVPYEEEGDDEDDRGGKRTTHLMSLATMVVPTEVPRTHPKPPLFPADSDMANLFEATGLIAGLVRYSILDDGAWNNDVFDMISAKRILGELVDTDGRVDRRRMFNVLNAVIPTRTNLASAMINAADILKRTYMGVRSDWGVMEHIENPMTRGPFTYQCAMNIATTDILFKNSWPREKAFDLMRDMQQHVKRGYECL